MNNTFRVARRTVDATTWRTQSCTGLIGSGTAESAGRHIVQQRLKQSGKFVPGKVSRRVELHHYALLRKTEDVAFINLQTLTTDFRWRLLRITPL